MRAALAVELYAALFSTAVTLPHSAVHELARFREAYAFDDRFTCHIRVGVDSTTDYGFCEEP